MKQCFNVRFTSLKHVDHGMTRKFQTDQLIDIDTDRSGVDSNYTNLIKNLYYNNINRFIGKAWVY